MRYKVFFLTWVLFLGMTAHVWADPIFTPLTFVLFSSPLGAVLGPGAIYTGLQVAAGAALSLGAQALAGRSRPTADPQEIKNTRSGTEGPGRYATGRVRLGGRIGMGNTAGYDIYRLLLHCFGPIDAIEEYFYDGRSITVDPDGSVTSPPWATSSGSNMYIRSKMGTGAEAAWQQLVNAFTFWTDAHRARGIGQTLLHIINPGTQEERFQTLLQGGVKELEIKARVGHFFDPRDGGTRWSLNGALQCLHWYRLLPDMRDDLIDFDALKAVADEADQQVPTLNGTAPRCTVSGGWEDALTTDIVGDMLKSAGLEVIRTAENKYTFRFIEDDPESELTLLNRHIIDREFAPEEAAKRPNICRVSYFSHERQGDLAEIDLSGALWARVQDDIDKYGKKEKHYKLPFCDNASQAQRIVRRLFWMDRAGKGIIRTNGAGSAVWGRRTITAEVADVGEDGKSAFIKLRIIAPSRFYWRENRGEIPVAIIPDELKTPWNAATMEQPAPPVLPDFQYESELDQPAPPSAAAVVQYSDGSWETRIKFTGVSGGTTAEANYRDYPGGLPDQWASMTAYRENGRYAWVAADTRGERADFRVRFADDDGNVSYFSDELTIEPMAVDNSATPAPDVSVGSSMTSTTYTATWTVSTNVLRAVKIVIEGNSGSGWNVVAEIDDIRPGKEYQASNGYSRPVLGDRDVDWRVSTLTSDGTVGAFATGDFTVPREPPA